MGRSIMAACRAALAGIAFQVGAAHAAAPPLSPRDVFDIEYASDPEISPDGRTIAYVRRSFDVQTDRARANIWLVDARTGAQRPLLSGTASYTAPRWSPDGSRIAFVSGYDRDTQIGVKYLDTGAVARVTNLTQAPQGIAWSPDGKRLAFGMFEPDAAKPFAPMPAPPKGATWAAPPRVIDSFTYRADGGGYLEQGHTHLFVVASDGGAPRRVTSGPFDDAGTPVWTPDGRRLIFEGDRKPTHETKPDPDIYSVDLASGEVRALTTRFGPDGEPAVSPDGKLIAFTGADDRYRGYEVTRLYVMNADGSGRRVLATGLERDAAHPQWRADGKAIWFGYDDKGTGKLGLATLDGGWREVASGLGGEDLGRPYGGVSFSVARGGAVAMDVSDPTHPADVAVLGTGGAAQGSSDAKHRWNGGEGGARRLTRLNDNLLPYRTLGRVEPLPVRAADGTEVGAWIVTPPGFDPAKKYPLILEIHGGPFTNYGWRYSVEMQAYAAAGYVVVYANPRGSTSYGDAYANAIDKNYPGPDYGDLMAVVDTALAKGFVDPARLFVTGGSGGGVLTAWIVGNTDRFRAAVVAKPVINWTSWVLTADEGPILMPYWLGKAPWEPGAQAEYWRRSPLSLVSKVKTPTMLLVGEQDFRTPDSETEQYYAALKLAGVETAMVRVPDIGHALVTRPTQLIAKTQYILAWFARHGGEAVPRGD